MNTSIYYVLLIICNYFTILPSSQNRKDRAHAQKIVNVWNKFCDDCEEHGWVRVTIYNTNQTNIFSLNTKTLDAISSLDVTGELLNDYLTTYLESDLRTFDDEKFNAIILCADIIGQQYGVALTHLLLSKQLSSWVPKQAEQIYMYGASNNSKKSVPLCVLF